MRKTAVASIAFGEVHQMADGRAGVKTNGPAASGDPVAFEMEGTHTLAKVSGVVIIDGAPVWWVYASNGVSPVPQTSGRGFFVGTAVCPGGDAASADLTVAVNLNVRPVYAVDLVNGHVWTTENVDGLGVTLLPGGGLKLEFDSATEAAQAAAYSEHTFTIASNPIMEGRIGIFNIGDNAALDIDFGLANGTHATNFESIAEFVAFHLDGSALDIKAHSDDGTTDVAPTDTTIDAVDDTYFYFCIDARDPTSCKLYINGVRVLSGTTFTLAAATGPLKPIFHMEKTSDDTVADVRIASCGVRTAEQ